MPGDRLTRIEIHMDKPTGLLANSGVDWSSAGALHRIEQASRAAARAEEERQWDRDCAMDAARELPGMIRETREAVANHLGLLEKLPLKPEDAGMAQLVRELMMATERAVQQLSRSALSR